jgi:hypothetical protein
MQIIDLSPDAAQTIQQVAVLLVEGFQENWPKAWPDLDSATAEEIIDNFSVHSLSLGLLESTLH